MANAWQQVDWIAMEALRQLQDALVISTLTARDKTADFNAKPNGYSVGDTVRIKTRPDYFTRDFDADGGNIVVQDIRESTRNMMIEKHFDISVAVSAREKALDLESFTEQVIIPAAHRLAESCDQYVGSKILNAAGHYASNDLFATSADMAEARKEATIQQLNPGGRFCLVDLDLEAKLLGAPWFNTYNERGPTGEGILNAGNMGRTMGMDFFSSINFPDATATAGTLSTTTDNGGGSNNLIGDKVLVVAASAGVQEGDRVKVAGVRRPMIVGSGSAGANIVLVDPITEIIPDGAAVTSIASGQTYSVNGAIFDDQSMAIAMPVLDPAADKPSSIANDNGYSIRVVQGYNMQTKTDTLSLDILVGSEAYDHRRITLLSEY